MSLENPRSAAWEVIRARLGTYGVDPIRYTSMMGVLARESVDQDHVLCAFGLDRQMLHDRTRKFADWIEGTWRCANCGMDTLYGELVSLTPDPESDGVCTRCAKEIHAVSRSESIAYAYTREAMVKAISSDDELTIRAWAARVGKSLPPPGYAGDLVFWRSVYYARLMLAEHVKLPVLIVAIRKLDDVHPWPVRRKSVAGELCDRAGQDHALWTHILEDLRHCKFATVLRLEGIRRVLEERTTWTSNELRQHDVQILHVLAFEGRSTTEV